MEKKESGFSYFDIMLALVIIGIVVVPIGTSMISSIKTALYSENIYQATLNAETVLKEVKEQIQEDIKANRNDSYSVAEAKSLQEFLKGTESDVTDEKHLAKVLGDKNFNYEVSVWRVKDTATTLNENDLVLRLATDTEESAFTDLSNETLVAFDLKLKDKVAENKLPLIVLGTKPSDDQVLEGEGISLNRKKDGSEYEITLKKNGSEYEVTNNKRVINDKKIINDKKVINDEKVINIKATNLNNKRTIRVTNSIKEEGSKGEPRNNIIVKLEDAGNMVILLPEEKKGKISIQRVEDSAPRPNYIIAVIVKEKKENGIFSTKGKILEKMIDIYSFHEN